MNSIYLTGIIQKIYEERQTKHSGAKFRKAVLSTCISPNNFKTIIISLFEPHYEGIQESQHVVIKGKLNLFTDGNNVKKTEINVRSIRILKIDEENKKQEELDADLDQKAITEYFKNKDKE